MLNPSKFPVLPMRADRFYRVMPFGDSLTSGTSTFSGWRGPLKRVLADLGVTNWEYVGSQTGQQGYLADYGRDWQHEAYGGETVTQLTARIATALTSNAPDVTVAMMGSNDGDTTDVQVIKGRFDRFFDAYFAVTTNPIVSLSRPPANTNGAITMDSVVQAGIDGWRLSVQGQLSRGRSVLPVDPHALIRDHFHRYMFSGDNTHYNELGYHQLALGIAEALAGRTRPPVAPTASVRITAAGTDFDFAEGASVAKLSSLDTFDVTTVAGRTVRIPAQWPVGTAWPAAVVRVHGADVTSGGAVAMSNIVASAFAPATRW